MKRTDMRKKINRNNNTTFGHRVSPTNILTSDFFDDHLWLQSAGHASSGVQIVELRSSDSDKSGKSINDDKKYDKHEWSYAQKNMDDDEKINETVDENKQQNEQNNAANIDLEGETSEYEDDFLYGDLFITGSCDMHNENIVYNQVNCFTILDKHLMTSETSEEDMEVIDCTDSSTKWARESRFYDSEVIPCGPDTESEKRTVWIYSFKNKHLLSDNDFELVNIPSQDSISSSVDSAQASLENSMNRVSTPIPPPYVPRLNLQTTPNLPTLTEMPEPGKLSTITETDDKQQKENVATKENNWFTSEQVTSIKEKVDQNSKRSILNWMALSPREKKRRFRNASPVNIQADLCGDAGHLPTVKEVSSVSEKNEETKPDEVVNVTDEQSSITCEKGSRDQSTLTEDHFQSTSSPNRSRRSGFEQIGTSLIGSAKKSLKSIRSNLASARAHSASVKEIRINAEVHAPDDRGDSHNIQGNIPRIKISPKPISKDITDPMEKLDSDNWIYEEKLIKDDRIRTPVDGKGDCASDALWARNLVLLKPADWAEYLPIAEADSIPSLNLSINTDSIEQNFAWFRQGFRRVGKLFRCCK